jgi:hypothetical protein
MWVSQKRTFENYLPVHGKTRKSLETRVHFTSLSLTRLMLSANNEEQSTMAQVQYDIT